MITDTTTVAYTSRTALAEMQGPECGFHEMGT